MTINRILQSFNKVGLTTSGARNPVPAFEGMLNAVNPANAQRAQTYYFSSITLPTNRAGILNAIQIPTQQPKPKGISLRSLRNTFKTMNADDHNAMSSIVLDKMLAAKNKDNTHTGGYFHEEQPLSKQDLADIKKQFMDARPHALITDFGGVKRNAAAMAKKINKVHTQNLHQNSFSDFRSQLQNSVRVAVGKLQHNYFLEGRDWGMSNHSHEKVAMRNHFLQNHEFAKLNVHHLDQILHEEFSKPSAAATPTSEGNRFKANKTAGTPTEFSSRMLHATQVKSISGRIYGLVNTLDTNDLAQLAKDKNIHLPNFGGFNKHVFGQGSYGKVRLARTEDNRLLAVKKFGKTASIQDPKTAAIKELAETAELRNSNLDTSRLNLPVDHAHTQVRNKQTGQLEDKSYVFMELAEHGDGHQLYNKLRGDYDQGKLNYNTYVQTNMPYIAHGYLASTAQLHNHGMAHHDIKPANMLHFNAGIKLTDFGLTSKGNQYTRGTRPFNPPELYHQLNPQLNTPQWHTSVDARKHDSFSLGMSILEMKMLGSPATHNGSHLMINNQPVTLQFFKAGDGGTVSNFNPATKDVNNSCYGTTGTRHLPGNTLDEVIAKLIDGNVHDRITPEEALRLPYFQQQAQPQMNMA